ncbi:MAG: LPS assembly lipoprotein LptE [Bacteroidales bacterium]|nr:LPS assembly lipoprotein LptE [Bacteroidales bacterium]
MAWINRISTGAKAIAALRLCAVALALCCFQACTISYKFNGAALDYNVYKTIHVSEFPIRAALVYPPLQQMFENELLDYITRNTRLQIVDGSSDLQMEGEITGYQLTPQAVTDNAYASQTRLTITVRLKYIDNLQDTNSTDQTFSAYRDFDASELLTDVQDELCQQICTELVDLIFNATLGNW